ncbi:hypothetical protein THTE_3041 [Thermogutta terrifontis]|uniref:Uncharacterized protein n=1 Tax=Thermogutta terrifontis TaxID=1331910 RepID=A0A286RI45_9BACT|nr:hypothetical protein THTE_3041 [Thermogutta terrifontis]
MNNLWSKGCVLRRVKFKQVASIEDLFLAPDRTTGLRNAIVFRYVLKPPTGSPARGLVTLRFLEPAASPRRCFATSVLG